MRRTWLVGTRISRNATRCNPDGWKLLLASSLYYDNETGGWCPKYRRKVLVGDVEQRLEHILYATAQQYGVLIETMEVRPDHVHLFVSSDPTRCVAEIVNRLKGASSRILRGEFPHLKSRLPTLWSRSYYAGTVGHV